MLDRLAASHFAPVLHQALQLALPDGGTLSTRVDAVLENPQARMPQAPMDQRTPFTVTLTALEPTTFLRGPCAMDLPELGTVGGVWVERMAALGRDHGGAYFQIVFS